MDITKCYATFYCRLDSGIYKIKIPFLTALTDTAGNPEAVIFSLKGTSESQHLALRELNKYCLKNNRSLLYIYKFSK